MVAAVTVVADGCCEGVLAANAAPHPTRPSTARVPSKKIQRFLFLFNLVHLYLHNPASLEGCAEFL